MSVKISSWVWHDCPAIVNGVRIVGRELIVLLALADISDDNGRCVYGDKEERRQEVLAAKARLSVSTFRRVIRRLEESKVITIEKDGLMNLYKIQTDVEGDDETTTGQIDLLISADSAADDGTEMSDFDRYYRSTVTGHKDVNVKEIINQSSAPAQVNASPAKSDDSIPHRPTPADLPRRAGIDWTTVIVSCPLFTYVEPTVLESIGAEILGRSGAKVLDPTAYVTKALTNDPFEWQQQAFAMEANRAQRGGNDF
jgi:hypothetical protein